MRRLDGYVLLCSLDIEIIPFRLFFGFVLFTFRPRVRMTYQNKRICVDVWEGLACK